MIVLPYLFIIRDKRKAQQANTSEHKRTQAKYVNDFYA